MDGSLGERHKSLARAQVPIKRYVMEKPVQVWSHAKPFLALGTHLSQRELEGCCCLGFPGEYSPL